MTKTKLVYQKYCEEEKSIPLFLQYLWFNAIYKKEEWNVVIETKGDNVLGFLPYVITKKKSFKIITTQFLSPYQGVWLNYPENQKYTNKVGFEKEVINSLIEHLPKVDAFKQKFFPEFTNWLPFNWQGFQQSTRYTYIINDLSDTEKVFAEFKENIRREIRKAEKLLTIETIEDVSIMYQLKLKVYQDNKETYPIPFSKLEKVYDFCKSTNCGELLMVKDEHGNIHSVLFYVWDNTSAHYLHGVTATEFKTSGSMSLLIWEAIKKSATKTRAFNFEGSMVESIERYFRAFGGVQTPYFQINKTNSKVLKLLKY